ncbi:MAG: cell division protein ZapB [Treponema sp.]|jgi:hypothetical protein|nr:cell division protein ZapB [Treponema sp.]
MVSLEQVKLLETRIDRAIGYVERVTAENTAFREKLDSYQKRIDELEALVRRFRDDQGRIEDGILAALDKLNKFEDALEKQLAPERSSPGRKGNPVSGAGTGNGKGGEKGPVTPPPFQEADASGAGAPENGIPGNGSAGEEVPGNGSAAEAEPDLPDDEPDPREPVEGELDIF